MPGGECDERDERDANDGAWEMTERGKCMPKVSCPDAHQTIVASPACEARARRFMLNAQAPLLDPQAPVIFRQAFDPRSSAR